MYGKMTTSRMGIIGRRFVSDFSFEVSIVSPGRPESSVPGRSVAATAEDKLSGELDGLTGLF